jgi:peroxiredoxin Q/BCP
MELAVGKKAPEIKLPDQDGKIHKLSDYKGQWVVLYFYPTDDTSGCTKEACSMRDNLPKFEKVDAVVLGVSKDSVASHKKFHDKYKLKFTLLADEEKKTVNDYGVWQEKKFMGKVYMGTVRTTFIIGPDGKIAKIYAKVKPEGHGVEVLKDLMGLQK